jgi:hypothetical protein
MLPFQGEDFYLIPYPGHFRQLADRLYQDFSLLIHLLNEEKRGVVLKSS